MRKSRIVCLFLVVFSLAFPASFINVFDGRVKAQETNAHDLSQLESNISNAFTAEFVKNPYAILSEYSKTVGPYLALVKHRIGESGFTSEEKTLLARHIQLEKEVAVSMRDTAMLTVTDFPFGVPIYSACIFVREDVVPMSACDEYLARLAPFYYAALRQYYTMETRNF